jgi:HD-GYP domain-containing protein (c-di-GMP phosphodiesterase class II)
MTLQLARALGVPEPELADIRRGAFLHDIGKMAIPDSILLKNGPLTVEERAVMERHAEVARRLLAGIPTLERAVDIPHHHHEKWDGSGYPQGLEGEDIPLAARIFAVVDVWDALTSDRPYRKALPHRAALTYIRSQAGIHFDPKVVDAFLRLDNVAAWVAPQRE